MKDTDSVFRGQHLTGFIKRALLAGLCAWPAIPDTVHSADSGEFWPEIALFYNLTPRTRIHLDAAYARGKESDELSLDTAAYVDISLKPIRRKELLQEDWQRNRYFWARLGVDRVYDVTAESGKEEAEDRAILSLYARLPLSNEIWLEGRARTDLRWIGEEKSQRYRFRVEASREFTVHRHAVVPYINVEWFYDSRYDDWARTLWQAGGEVTLSRHFRIEGYLASQRDRQPEETSLIAVGLVAKWYF